MMIWFETGQNTSFRVVLNTISCLQTPYTKNPPGSLSPHEKWYFLKVFFNFKWKFHNLVNTCWPKYFFIEKYKNLLYETFFQFFHIPHGRRKILAFVSKYCHFTFSNNYLQMWFRRGGFVRVLGFIIKFADEQRASSRLVFCS